jgi:cyclophilin family peptidyl-prolyl cis-trans isomerase
MVQAGFADSLHDWATRTLLDFAAVSKSSKRERQRLNREARRQYEESVLRRRRMFRYARTLAIIVVPIIAAGVIISVSGEEKISAAERVGCREISKKPKAKDTHIAEAPAMSINPFKTYIATVQTSCGSFTIQLDVAQSPKNVNSFVFLSNEGYYDGLNIFRIAPGFVFQTGAPNPDGSGEIGYNIPDELPTDGYQQGTVAVANGGQPNTGNEQFFVILSDSGAAGLGGPPYTYTKLGQVTDGFETVRKIGKLGNQDETPKAIVILEKITISEQDAAATTTTTTTATTTTTTAAPTTTTTIAG